jgi:methionyl-tRNA formyltransferase
MKIIFFGTSEFAVPALEALVAAGMQPAAVVTLPDRSRGRGLQRTPSPVKIAAARHGILVWQQEKLSDPEFLKKFSETEWDVGVVAAYGKLIPQPLINLPKKGFLNIHPSLLPELRGPSPIQYAILEGKEKTGVTIVLVDAEMDHGPILLQENVAINPKDTAAALEIRLAKKGAEMLVQSLPQWINGTMQARPQDHVQATFSKKIGKEDGHINWNGSAEQIERAIRAFHPWPGTFTFGIIQQKKVRLKIVAAVVVQNQIKPPGLVSRHEDDMIVACGSDALRIVRIQLEGKHVLSGKEFLNGYRAIVGTTLYE